MEAKFMHFAGIDVSKFKIDVCLIFNALSAQFYH